MSVALLALYTLVFTRQPADRAAAAGIGAVAAKGGGHAATAKPSRAAPTRSTAKVKAPPAAAAPAAPRDTSASPADTTQAGAAPKVAVPETWGTDPFVRDWVMLNELANLSLKAITVGGDHAYALINNQILEEGDEISGKRIVRIESDKVTLEQGGRTFTLTLGE